MHKQYKYHVLVLLMVVIGVNVGQLFFSGTPEILTVMVDCDTESDQNESLEDDLKEVFLAFLESDIRNSNSTSVLSSGQYNLSYPKIQIQINTPPPEL